MEQPSRNWEPDERLKVIKRIGEKIEKWSAGRAPSSEVLNQIFDLAEIIVEVTFQHCTVLEENRQKIMDACA